MLPDVQIKKKKPQLGFSALCDELSVGVLLSPPAYSTFYIVGLVLSMQIPFVGFQPIRTSEHMAAAGR